MKKILSVFLAVIMIFALIVPVVSVTGYGLVSFKTDDGDYYNPELAALSGSLADIIPNYDEFRAYLVSEMQNCNEAISISKYKINRNNISLLSACIQYDLIEIFHRASGYSYSYSASTGNISTLYVSYNMTQSEYNQAMDICDSVTESFIGDLRNNNSLSQAEKALLVHDRLASWCEYDEINYENNTVSDLSHQMYGTLVNGISVCSGYARSYKYALNKLGIDCILCDSDILNHEWNIVTIDGVKYHVDVTWDDPVYDVFGRVLHENFLLSTDGIIATGHEANDFDDSPVSTAYESYYWQCSQTEFQYKNGCLYYFDTDNKQLKKIDNGTTSTLLTVSDKWRASATGSYAKSFVRLDSDNLGNYLLYSTPSCVKKYDLDTGEVTDFYTPEISGSYYWIYGFKAQQGKLYLNIYNSPNFTSDTAENNIIYNYGGEPIPTHTVTYNYSANGGTSATVTSAEVAEGESVDLSVTAYKEGWTFVGWYTSSNNKATISDYTMGLSDVTLYAVFSKSLNITFDDMLISGLKKTMIPTIYNNLEGYPVTMSNLREYTGWTPLGWTAETTADAQPIAAGTNQTVSDDITYYALYGRDVTVSYNTAGSSTSVPSQTVQIRFSTADAYYYPEVTIKQGVTKTGYTFAGWYTDDNVLYTPGTVITPHEDIALTAHWEKNEIPVTFSENYQGGASAQKTVLYDSAYGELPVPSQRAGYTFDGWFTRMSGGIQITADTIVTTNGAHTLYAHWSAQNVNYTVEHYVMNTNGGYSSQPDASEQKTAPADSSVTLSALKLSSLEVAGGISYSFGNVGGATVTGTAVSPDGTTVIKLYYTRSRYTVALNADDGIDSVSGAGEYYYDADVSITAAALSGYTFDGWFNGDDEFGADETLSFKMPAGNLSLTARASSEGYFSVNENNTAEIDRNGMITGLKTELTLAQLRDEFLSFSGVDVKFTKATRNAKYYGTGSRITVTYADGTVEEYTLVIYGDIDGNGVINSDDIAASVDAVIDSSELTAEQKKAVNVDGMRGITSNDVAVICDAAEGFEINQVDPTA